MWVIHSWLADSQNTKVLYGSNKEEVPCFAVGFLKSWAPHSPYVTQPLAGRGVRRTIQTFLLPCLSQKLWAGLQAQREVWHLGRCVCCVELLLRDLCAPWAIGASSARVKWCLGRPKAIGELLPLCYHRNVGLSEQQCSDAVGSSWLQYSTCTCVIYVTSAMFGHEFTCSGAKINFFWVFYGDFLASITLHVAFSGVTIFHPSESVVWQISFKCTTSYRSFCSNIHCYIKKAKRGLGFCTYLNALNFVREPFKIPCIICNRICLKLPFPESQYLCLRISISKCGFIQVCVRAFAGVIF